MLSELVSGTVVNPRASILRIARSFGSSRSITRAV
jgi:hypothetical protein